MTRIITCSVFILMVAICNRNKASFDHMPSPKASQTRYYAAIGDIPAPTGYKRMTVENNSFGEWLRERKLRKDSNVYLYNGSLKRNQTAQFAVLDIPIGHKDLQQCADAVLRLRAEYFLDRNEPGSIIFNGSDGTRLSFQKWLGGERYRLNGNRLLTYQAARSPADKRIQFEQYLEILFSYCGTYSLDKGTRPVHDFTDIQPGDVFVKPGSPGHAMIIVDVAVNHKGEKVFLLAQGFMPAQDIHIVKNPMDQAFNPWYRVTLSPVIITPGWTFYRNQLKTWE